MNPYMVIILLETYIISFFTITIHISNVSYFYIRAVFHYKTKSIKYSILSNSFNCHSCCYCIKIKVSFCKDCWICYITYKSDRNRSCFFTFLISKNNILNTCTINFTFACCINLSCYCILIFFCNINNNSITL